MRICIRNHHRSVMFFLFVLFFWVGFLIWGQLQGTGLVFYSMQDLCSYFLFEDGVGLLLQVLLITAAGYLTYLPFQLYPDHRSQITHCWLLVVPVEGCILYRILCNPWELICMYFSSWAAGVSVCCVLPLGGSYLGFFSLHLYEQLPDFL